MLNSFSPPLRIPEPRAIDFALVNFGHVVPGRGRGGRVGGGLGPYKCGRGGGGS